LIIIPGAPCAHFTSGQRQNTFTTQAVAIVESVRFKRPSPTWVTVMQSTAYIVSGPLAGVRASQFAGYTAIRPSRWSPCSRHRIADISRQSVTFGSWTISMQIVDQQRLLDIRAKEGFMPALSSTMTEGVIVAWLKKPGDKVTVGEMIMTVESDKADMDGTKF
jgi:hypothetical protein